jgi:succinyl-diaminopimelate desuccinylase
MVTIGGGTYAKEAKNTVAFGSKFPGKEDFIHENDEKIDLEDLQASIAIYARAIYDLGHLDETKK